MGADGHPPTGSRRNHSLHHHGIAGVEATGDVGRGHQPEELFLAGELVPTEAFDQVGIEINARHVEEGSGVRTVSRGVMRKRKVCCTSWRTRWPA